jgi:hypothetical protein
MKDSQGMNAKTGGPHSLRDKFVLSWKKRQSGIFWPKYLKESERHVLQPFVPGRIKWQYLDHVG